MGGFVAVNRLMGQIAVARALGDRHFKTNGSARHSRVSLILAYANCKMEMNFPIGVGTACSMYAHLNKQLTNAENSWGSITTILSEYQN